MIIILFFVQLIKKQPKNVITDEKIKTFDDINLTICKKRKYDDIEEKTENINELMLIDGMSVSKNQNKKCKVSLTEEKQLKLAQEKVLNFFFTKNYLVSKIT